MDPDMKSLAYVERILMIWIFSTSDFQTFVVVDSVTHTDMHYFKYKAPKNKVLFSFPHIATHICKHTRTRAWTNVRLSVLYLIYLFKIGPFGGVTPCCWCPLMRLGKKPHWLVIIHFFIHSDDWYWYSGSYF